MRGWIAQPEKSRICGQIAVAVLAEIPLTESIRLFGSERGTNTRKVARVLRDLGFHVPHDRLVRLARPPALGLGKLNYGRGRNWHWVVFDGPYVWDGAYGTPFGTVEWPSHARVTSYLPVNPPSGG